MDRASYDAFADRLVASLAARDEVLGVVAAGSFASGPDEWSDHDFLVVTDPADAETLRLDTSWLPDHDRLVLHFRENAQGMKAVYDDGHLVEYTVLAPEQLGTMWLNRTRVLLDRADIAKRVSAVMAWTPELVEAAGHSDDHLHGQLLTALLVGVQRHRRGEHLSALDFVHHFALQHFLTLLARHVTAEQPEAQDNLNPFRRVELAHPAVAGDLRRLFATGDLEEVARGLLEVAARELAGAFDTGAPAWQVVRRSLEPTA
jgi:predicted nucleotidyltransferase